MHKISITLTLILMTLVQSCKKEKQKDECTQSLLDKEGLAYIQIPKGKYFIYKDSISGLTDSVIVTKSEFTKTRGEKCFFDICSCLDIQVYTLTLSKILGSGISAWFHAKTPGRDEIFYGIVFDFQDDDKLTTFDYKPSWGPNPNVRIIPSAVVEGKTYTDIYEYVNRDSITLRSNRRKEYWWVKGVGLIRFMNLTTTSLQTFTLLRNN